LNRQDSEKLSLFVKGEVKLFLLGFFLKALFKKIVAFEIFNFKTEVDYNGRCEAPVGITGRLRPRRLAEEAQASPHGKRAS
jgi:hypothetical protein